jgi:hypothetical protein
MTLGAAGVDVRSSVESIDTEDVLLPLLARLGITVDLGVSSTTRPDVYARASDQGDQGDQGDGDKRGRYRWSHESDESDASDEVVYIVDRFGCVVIDDDGDDEEHDDKNEADTDDWRITSSTDRQGYVSGPRSSTRVVYLHKMPEAQRQELAVDLYRKYNRLIFDDALPQDMDVSWNKKLTSTAGLTHYKRLIDRRRQRQSIRAALSWRPRWSTRRSSWRGR